MKITTREMILVSFFASISVVAAMFSKYGGEAAVPFSLMPLIVMLAGTLLGGRLGALSILVYVLLGMVGVPVFASPPYGGLVYLLNPSAGFLFGFMLGAYAIGKTLEVLGTKNIVHYIIANLVGLVAIYLVGIPYLYIVLNYYVGAALSVGQVIQLGLLPFITFDLIKVVLGAILGHKMHSRLQGLNN